MHYTTALAFSVVPLPARYCTFLAESLSRLLGKQYGLTKFRLHNKPG